MPAENGHLQALIGLERGISEPVKGGGKGANTFPQAAMPIPDRGDLPAADQVVQAAGDISTEALSPAKGKVIDGVVTNPMRGDIRVVVITETEPLIEAEIGIA
jgi:hypothetical protein